LLIDDEEIGGSALSLLRSANFTDGAVWSAGRWRETFFAKILYRGMEVPPEHLDHGALQINLEPLRGQFFAASPQDRERNAEGFRAEILATEMKISLRFARRNSRFRTTNRP